MEKQAAAASVPNPQLPVPQAPAWLMWAGSLEKGCNSLCAGKQVPGTYLPVDCIFKAVLVSGLSPEWQFQNNP